METGAYSLPLCRRTHLRLFFELSMNGPLVVWDVFRQAHVYEDPAFTMSEDPLIGLDVFVPFVLGG